MRYYSSYLSGRLTNSICLLLVFCALMAISGCGNDLSRGKAENILKAALTKEYDSFCLMKQYNNEQVCAFIIMNENEKQNVFPDLERDGLLRIKGYDKPMNAILISCYVEFTKKAEPYLVKYVNDKIAVITAEADSVTVTGISKPSDAFGKKMCAVDYKAIYKLTPFGEAWQKRGYRINLEESRTVDFILYDDGWRISR